MKRTAAAIALLLLSCSHTSAPPSGAANTADLESAAIRAGVIDDPASVDLTGLYARDTDRLCIVPQGTAFRIGVSIDFGDQLECNGAGTVTRSGGSLHVSFPGASGCEFDARFEGDRILFPGALPDACQSLCSRRASLAGLTVDRLSDSRSEAAAMRDAAGRRSCAG